MPCRGPTCGCLCEHVQDVPFECKPQSCKSVVNKVPRATLLRTVMNYHADPPKLRDEILCILSSKAFESSRDQILCQPLIGSTPYVRSKQTPSPQVTHVQLAYKRRANRAGPTFCRSSMSSQPSTRTRVPPQASQVSSLHSSVALPSSPDHPGSSMVIDGHFDGSLTENHTHHGTRKEIIKGCRSQVTIDMLPDVALLTIFDFYMVETAEKEINHMNKKDMEVWLTLVHVCRKWRNVGFGSPRRLNMRLWCCSRTLARAKLDVWPPLPIVVRSSGEKKRGLDLLIAALGHNDRVCGIDLYELSNSQTEEVIAAMQQPFPELTHLHLRPQDARMGGDAPGVPASFLGGSAPRLQFLYLFWFSFPGLPNLLLSATHLVSLELRDIPHSGYIAPEAMATGLSVLTRLEKLEILFRYPPPRPDQKGRRPPPPTRPLLPVLAELEFEGDHEYLEDLVARIDTPLLNQLSITFSTFDAPQLAQFISQLPSSKAHNEARVTFSDTGASIELPRAFDGALELEISFGPSVRQLSWMAQLCSSSFPQALIPMVEHLYFLYPFQSHREDFDFDTEESKWLELLRPFTSVKYLYIPYEFEQDLAGVLQGLVGESVVEVLPALQTLFVVDYSTARCFQDAIGPFLAARQLSGHPITISDWDGE